MNGGSALRTCKMNLNQRDIADFDYRDLIHLEIDNVSTYWTVNKIKDYKPNQEVLTTVELVEYKTKIDFNHRKQTTSTGTKDIPIGTRSLTKKFENNNFRKLDNSNNKTKGSGIALGDGIIANNNQTVVGNYNVENTEEVFSVGYGTNDTDRQTAFSIDSCGEVKVQGGSSVSYTHLTLPTIYSV